MGSFFFKNVEKIIEQLIDKYTYILVAKGSHNMEL